MTLPGYQSIKRKLILFKIQRCENNWPFFRLFGLCLIYYHKLFLTSICIFVSESMKLISIPSAKTSHKNCRQSFEKWWITLRCYVENTITFSKKSVGNRIENDSADNSTQSIDIDGSLKTVIFKQPQCSGFNFFVDSKTESEIVAHTTILMEINATGTLQFTEKMKFLRIIDTACILLLLTYL